MAGAVVKGTVVGVPLAGIGGTGITYQLTKGSLGEALNEKYGYNAENIPEDSWTKVFEKFKGKTDFQDEEFKSFLTEANKTSSDKKATDLRDLCQKKFNLNYKSIFVKGNESLLGEVKKACFISIKDSLDASSYETDASKLDHDLLKDYATGESKPELKTPLIEAQETLKKTEVSDKSGAQTTHVNWCKSTAESRYLGPSDDNHKIFVAICKKKAGSSD